MDGWMDVDLRALSDNQLCVGSWKKEESLCCVLCCSRILFHQTRRGWMVPVVATSYFVLCQNLDRFTVCLLVGRKNVLCASHVLDVGT
jgi:hypothetical protein